MLHHFRDQELLGGAKSGLHDANKPLSTALFPTLDNNNNLRRIGISELLSLPLVTTAYSLLASYAFVM